MVWRHSPPSFESLHSGPAVIPCPACIGGIASCCDGAVGGPLETANDPVKDAAVPVEAWGASSK